MLPALSLLCQTPIVPHTQANASRVASQGTQCSGAVGSTDQARRGGLRCGFRRRHLCTAVGWRGCRSAAGLRLTQLRSRPAVCQIESTATRCPFEVYPSEHQVRRCVSLIKSSTPGEIRTHDLRIRNPRDYLRRVPTTAPELLKGPVGSLESVVFKAFSEPCVSVRLTEMLALLLALSVSQLSI